MSANETKNYAIIADDNSGPALGLGDTPEAAWASAAESGVPDRSGLKCVRVTETSASRIAAGNVDDVEIER